MAQTNSARFRPRLGSNQTKPTHLLNLFDSVLQVRFSACRSGLALQDTFARRFTLVEGRFSYADFFGHPVCLLFILLQAN